MNKYMITAILQYAIEAPSPGEAIKSVENTRFQEKLGNLHELSHIMAKEIPGTAQSYFNNTSDNA